MTGSCRATRRCGRNLALTSVALGLMLTTAPLPWLSVDEAGFGAVAWAGNGGNGGGNGNGNGGVGNGGGDRGNNGKGGDHAGRGQGAGSGSFDDRGRGRAALPDIEAALGGFFAPRGNGRGAAGAKAEARERYAAFDGRAAAASRTERSGESFGRRQVVLDADLADALVGSGWRGPGRSVPDGFRNHGDRVRTMVEIAKTLGYGAHVGALQANFGTPMAGSEPVTPSPDRASVVEELAEARAELEALQAAGADDTQAALDRITALEQALAALDAPSPAPEWDGDWRTADLDLNDDGRVDHADLDLARAAIAPVEDTDLTDDASLAPEEEPVLAEPTA